jgi:DNA primase
MMNQNAKETIRAKLPIETVVGSYIKLEKSGKNFRGCCPFHNEKTPSFYVTPSLGIYKCFGCHKGGDIFKFVEEIENIPFLDALKQLAEKAGVSLDEYKSEKPSRIAILREIMDTAAKFYEVAFRKNPEVVAYLESRGMTKDIMVTWRVGYAEKGWSNLYDYLRRKYSDQDILDTGLCLQGKQQGLYDRFRERIMFPIADSQGRVIAFTGRVMPGTEEASREVGKYINSPETELYHKSSVLFGFDKAKSSIHSQGFAIIVEGQMDCIMSHQAGVTNVVALSGTASTDLHMEQLARFTGNVALCLDADKAGLAAAQKTAMVAYQHEMKVLVIDVKGGKDPADMIKDNPDAWKETVSHKKDFITFRLEKMKEQDQLANKTVIAEKELFPILAHIQSQIILDDKLQEIAHAFGSSNVMPVREEFEKFRKKNPLETPKPAYVAPKSQENNLEERILGLLIVLEKSDPRFDEKIKAMSPEDQAQYKFQTEHLLGELPGALPVYERTLNDLLVRHELVTIDAEKQQLDKKLVHDPQNAELLQKIHELLRRKDALIHTLSNQ